MRSPWSVGTQAILFVTLEHIGTSSLGKRASSFGRRIDCDDVIVQSTDGKLARCPSDLGHWSGSVFRKKYNHSHLRRRGALPESNASGCRGVHRRMSPMQTATLAKMVIGQANTNKLHLLMPSVLSKPAPLTAGIRAILFR